ncbi:MAG: phosphate ABC transporter permease PstA [Pseudomonadota bacterium]
MLRSKSWRRGKDMTVKVVSSLAALAGIAALAWILYEVIARGASAINWDFFTSLPEPPGVEGGGVANAIVGTALITGLATILGVPAGILAGVYLNEFGRKSRIGNMVRFCANVMMGIPSIIVGLFVYTVLVVPVGHFSGYAGAAALAIIMMPIVARTAEDMMGLVPNELRESALALGAARWKVTLGIVFRAAKTGLITGVILSVARVSGETAPLLFTSLNSPYWTVNPAEPTANLTVTVFNFAMSPYPIWQQTAWGASLLIIAAVLILTIVTRFVFREKKK